VLSAAANCCADQNSIALPRPGCHRFLLGTGARRKGGLFPIEPLLKDFPDRRFVLIGDSGEKDPEIYGAMARKHPEQIARILIRDVTGQSAGATRYTRAFVDVPKDHWRIFKEPSEIQAAIAAGNFSSP
jgi:phosphatidate phosphatase APP1